MLDGHGIHGLRAYKVVTIRIEKSEIKAEKVAKMESES